MWAVWTISLIEATTQMGKLISAQQCKNIDDIVIPRNQRNQTKNVQQKGT